MQVTDTSHDRRYKVILSLTLSQTFGGLVLDAPIGERVKCNSGNRDCVNPTAPVLNTHSWQATPRTSSRLLYPCRQRPTAGRTWQYSRVAHRRTWCTEFRSRTTSRTSWPSQPAWSPTLTAAWHPLLARAVQ